MATPIPALRCPRCSLSHLARLPDRGVGPTIIVTYRCDDCRTVFTPRAASLTISSARAEEMWRVTKGGQLMICELHPGDRAGASWEVVIKRDGEWLFGRLCPERSFARYVAHALKHDHLKSGWVESYGARIAGGRAEAL